MNYLSKQMAEYFAKRPLDPATICYYNKRFEIRALWGWASRMQIHKNANQYLPKYLGEAEAELLNAVFARFLHEDDHDKVDMAMPVAAILHWLDRIWEFRRQSLELLAQEQLRNHVITLMVIVMQTADRLEFGMIDTTNEEGEEE